MVSPTNAENERLCQYKGQPCRNERARNRNGALLQLCEEHRSLANRNQRRYRLRQQLQVLKAESKDDNIQQVKDAVRKSYRGSQSLPQQAVSSESTEVDEAIEAWFVATFGTESERSPNAREPLLDLQRLGYCTQAEIEGLLDEFFDDRSGDDQPL